MGSGLPESEEREYHLILAEERLDEAHLLLEQNFYNGAVSEHIMRCSQLHGRLC
jgi:uncharacterized protein (UPF0332 family)